MAKVEINTPAPDFELIDFLGTSFCLSNLRGRNALLVFNRTFT